MSNFNKLYILIIFFLLIVMGLVLNAKKPKKQEIFMPTDSQIIKTINEKNKNIKSINCEVQGFHITPINGLMFYKKHDKFRLKINSIFDKELDLGSNEKIFWFWIRRFDKKIYYWQRGKESNVISEFDPEYIRESLSIDEIPEDSLVLKSGDEYKIINTRKNQNGTNVIKVWLVRDSRIVSHELYDESYNLFLICNLKDFKIIDEKWVASTMEINSHQLGSMTLHLKNIKLNHEADEINWIMPKEYDAVDISK